MITPWTYCDLYRFQGHVMCTKTLFDKNTDYLLEQEYWTLLVNKKLIKLILLVWNKTLVNYSESWQLIDIVLQHSKNAFM